MEWANSVLLWVARGGGREGKREGVKAIFLPLFTLVVDLALSLSSSFSPPSPPLTASPSYHLVPAARKGLLEGV